MAEPNRYWVHYSYAEAPEPWALDGPGDAYLRGVLGEMDRRLGPRGLRVVITWRLDVLPDVGGPVVAVVMGDEWARVPAYAGRVLATFKAYGRRPHLGRLPRDPHLAALLVAQHVRVKAHGWAGRRAYARAAARPGGAPPVVPIPLGYGNQLALPVRPMAERATDLVFAGSVAHGRYGWRSPQRWVAGPKTVARRRMLESLGRIARRRPWRVRVATTSAFALNALHYGTPDAASVLDAETYSEALMDARLCLAPRGTSAETFRWFEGLRAGCVVIADPLPPHPFYAGAPTVEVSDWRTLDRVASRLLGDPGRLESMQARGLAWWRDRCSEAAVGARMAETIRERLPRPIAVGGA